jgi:hypothetical protein
MLSRSPITLGELTRLNIEAVYSMSPCDPAASDVTATMVPGASGYGTIVTISTIGVAGK